MTVSPTSSTPAATTTPSATDAATTDLTQNYSTFLTLLTTQLKNQDPLNPMDSSQFTSQLVQFSSVEQQIASNKNLTTLISAQNLANQNTAVNYIGRTVSAISDSINLSNSASSINYALDSDVADNSITISDQNGKTVRVLKGETGTGAHSITWDGKDQSGTQMPDGTYQVSIAATNTDQTAASATVGISGVVTGMAIIDDAPVLAIGGVTIPMSNVLSVSGVPVTNSTGTNS